MGIPERDGPIVVVDDDASVRAAVYGVLESVGLSAQSFASAEAFLSSDVLDETVCVITDLKMPGMSGLQLQQELIKRGSRVPVIFISAHRADADRERALGAGAAAFLDKPFDDELLIQTVRNTLV